MKTYEKRRKEEETWKTIIYTYSFIGIISCIVLIGGIISLDIAMDREYQSYYYLAQDCGSPGEVVTYLDIYLEKVDGLHGNTGLLYQDARNDLDNQKNVVKSFRDRSLELTTATNVTMSPIATSLSFASLTDDMYSKQLKLIRWNILNENPLMLLLSIFVSFIWWWSLILLIIWEFFRYD